MKIGLFLLVAALAAVAYGNEEEVAEVEVEEGTCSPNIHVIFHHDHERGRHGHGAHHDHGEDSSHEEADHHGHDHEGHEADHEHDDGEHDHGPDHEHGASHEGDEHEHGSDEHQHQQYEVSGCNSHIHIHLTPGDLGFGHGHAGHHEHDSAHHNTLMSDSDDPDSYLYAGAVLIPAVRRGPNGYIAFRQKLHGGDVEVKYRATGISMTGHDHDSMSHDHEVHVHQYGDCRRGCSKIGDGFHPTHDTADHAPEEGYLGHVQCNMEGTIDQTVTYSNEELSLVGAHSAIGRSIAVHDMGPAENELVVDSHEGHDHSEHGGHSENAIIMCGAIVYTNGQVWGTEDSPRTEHWWFW